MAVIIQDGSASFRDKAMGWAGCPIDSTGLELAHFFGGTLENSLRNFSFGKSASVAVGAPSPRTNSLALQGRVNYVQTAMADANEVTLVVAFKPTEAVDTIVAGNLVSTTGGTGRKLAIVYGGSQMLVSGFRGTESNASGPLLPTPLTVGTPVCVALRNSIGTGAEITLSNLTSGEVAKTLNPGAPSLGSPIRVGSGYIAGYGGKSEVYAVLGFSRRLSDVELTTLYSWLKSYCARRSITI